MFDTLSSRAKRGISTLLVLCALATNTSFALQAVDDLGQIIKLNHAAKRVISLSPDVTEIIFSIGAGEHIVGVINYSNYPAAAKQIQVIGSFSGLDVERIIALKPDLIVTWGRNFAGQLQQLQKLGVSVYHSDPHQLEDVAATMRKLGVLTGYRQQANKIADAYLQKLSDLREQYANNKPVRVFYQLSGDALMTVNHTSWINQAIKLCGGHNVFAEVKLSAPTISLEAVIAANPDVIISAASSNEWQQQWQPYQMITAVKKQRFVTIDPDLIDRAGPRLLEGVGEMCSGINQ